MKGKRYSEEQIVRVLQEVDGGKSVAGVCREYGVSEQSVYRWRTKYGGMEVSDVRRLRQLEEENRWLKKLVADQALDIQLLTEINPKKVKGPARRRNEHNHEWPHSSLNYMIPAEFAAHCRDSGRPRPPCVPTMRKPRGQRLITGAVFRCVSSAPAGSLQVRSCSDPSPR